MIFSINVLKLKVNTGKLCEFVNQICEWAKKYENQVHLSTEKNVDGKYICAAPVMSCMEAYSNNNFAQVCQNADLVCPDGMPIVWALRKLGHSTQKRVCGPDLMLALCREAEIRKIPIGLYGTNDSVLKNLQEKLLQAYPQLTISFSFAPPMRDLDAPVPDQEIEAIRKSGAQILFVGLGCPKQEYWMANQKEKLPLVMLGVGAAFLFHSGQIPRSPVWMQNLGLEWVYRLYREPRRLFKRYLLGNLGFLWQTRFLSKKRLNHYAKSNLSF